MASPKVCRIHRCSKRHKAKGLCHKHYHRLLRHGDPLAGGKDRSEKPHECIIEGCCSKIIKANGLCSKHYDRWWKHGDPLSGKPSPQPGLICSAEGCSKPHKAKGLCDHHYGQSRKKGPRNGGATKHHLYACWSRIINRCHCPTSASYYNYGGRGIRVCEKWRNDFWAFAADMPPRPSPKHSIERIDNEKGYEPGNCRWATAAEQARNQRSNKIVTIDGRTQVVAAWAAEKGIPSITVYGRLWRGWSEYDAVMTPSGQWRKDGKLRGVCSENMLQSARRTRIKNRKAYKAHYVVANAIAAGCLIRKPCEVCGNPISDGHHEDYSKPLEVEWLCSKHHRERHKTKL